MKGYPRDPQDPRRRLSPSAARNKGPILEVLSEYLAPTTALGGFSEPLKVLEIASGTGEHVAFYAQHLHHVIWQPSEWSGHASLDFERQDVDDICTSISAWTEDLPNVLPPIALDASSSRWPVESDSADPKHAAVLAANVAHIAPLSALHGLIAGANRILKPGGKLFLYGPFAVAGETLGEGNARFNKNLREVNADWGLREISEIASIAAGSGLHLESVRSMPANNKMLVFSKGTAMHQQSMSSKL